MKIEIETTIISNTYQADDLKKLAKLINTIVPDDLTFEVYDDADNVRIVGHSKSGQYDEFIKTFDRALGIGR